MSLAIGNLRQALRDETRMVLGQLFLVSAATVNSVTVFNQAEQQPVQMTASSANVFVGCLIRFRSGKNLGIYYLVTGAAASVSANSSQPLVLTVDQPFAFPVAVNDTFEIYTASPAFNGQSNVAIGGNTANFGANSAYGTQVSETIESGVFSTPNNQFIAQCIWDTECPIGLLFRNANGFDSYGNVTGWSDLSEFVLPGSPGQQGRSRSFILRGAFTGPFSSGSLSSSVTAMQFQATCLGSSGASASALALNLFAI